MDDIEYIQGNGQLLACIIKATFKPEKTTFLTDPELPQQVGFIVYGRGQEIRRHAHREVKRTISRSAEVLLVVSGHSEVDLFDDNKKLVATREIRSGDVILLASGAHGFRMIDETTFLEVKQGPYFEEIDKEYF